MFYGPLFVRKEEKSVQQFLSNTVSSTVVRTGTGHPCLAPRPRAHSKALVVAMTIFASSWFVPDYLAEEIPVVAVLSSLLSGFAPLIGVGVLIIIIALLISFLICTVERALADEDDGIVSEPHIKSRWRRVAHSLPDLLAHCLSLKEHSPPAFLFS